MIDSGIATTIGALADRDIGTIIGLWVGTALFLGLGGFALIFAIYKLASGADVDITASSSTGQSAQIGRGGLIAFIILGGLGVIVGIALLVAAIRAVA